MLPLKELAKRSQDLYEQSIGDIMKTTLWPVDA
jgi:hypothetical protein